MKILFGMLGLFLIGGGAALLYFSYKRKFIKMPEGQTLKDVKDQVMAGDLNAGMKQGLKMGFGAWSKVMGMVGGGILMLMGCLFLFLTMVFSIVFH